MLKWRIPKNSIKSQDLYKSFLWAINFFLEDTEIPV